MLKTTLLSLAIAGSLTASQFLDSTKDFAPQDSIQNLNKEAKLIKKNKTKTFTGDQISGFQTSVNMMMEVNERTYTDFLPVLESSIQRWVKEDKGSVIQALDMMMNFLQIRLKQYSNLINGFKHSNVPQDILNKVAKMRELSREAKKIIATHQTNVEILISINEDLTNIKEIKVEEFWLPNIGEQNTVIVKIKDLKEDDFQAMEEASQRLNELVTSPYIDTIMAM